MSPEEEKEFDVTYPAEYGQERLAGKTVRFRTRVKAVRRKELPELNDEFARDLGDYQNLGELRDAIRKSIFAEREYAAQQEAKGKIVDSLVKSHDFPVPEAYVDFQIENNVRRSLREITGRDVDLSSLKLDWSKIRERQSRRQLRTSKHRYCSRRSRTPSRFTRPPKRSIANCSGLRKPSGKLSQPYVCGSKRTAPSGASRRASGRRKLSISSSSMRARSHRPRPRRSRRPPRLNSYFFRASAGMPSMSSSMVQLQPNSRSSSFETEVN